MTYDVPLSRFAFSVLQCEGVEIRSILRMPRDITFFLFLMFSFNPFHALSSSNKTPENKNLATYLESEHKIASAWLRLADDRRIAANHLKTFGHPLGDDLTVSLLQILHCISQLVSF